MAIGSLIGIILHKPVFGQDLIVTPIIPIPGKVVQNTVINNIQYQITNTSTGSLSVTFDNLNAQGKTYTTTCGTVAAAGTCLINITFKVPPLPAGKTSEWYPHTFKILGGSSPVPYGLGTTIVESASSITPTFNISFSDGTKCEGQAFDVTLNPDFGVPVVYNSIPCGTSSPTPGIPGGTYTLSVTPSQVVAETKTFDAPASFPYHLAKVGDTANIVYALNQDVSVSTNLTMPNVGSETSTITCTGTAGTYGPHAQSSGSTSFDTMKPGSYTCTATNYIGTDSETHTPTLSNPYTISASPGQDVIAISFTAVPPASTAVSTILTTPNLPAGNTVSCTLSDAGNTYTHAQPTGTAHFAQVVDATDYTFSCVNYTVGSDVYSMTTQTGVTVDSSHSTLTGVFSKNAPPGTNYDWSFGRLATILKNANIAAVYWGGGSTTAPVTFGNPAINDFLNASIATYESATTPVLSTAHIQNFPSYIAMGTVATQTSDVNTQLEAQHLDITNKYEGNGDGNAGCAWDNQQGYQILMTPGTGTYGTPIASAQTYQVFTNYYDYATVNYTTNLTAPNLTKDATLNIKMVNAHGDTYVQNVAAGDGTGGGVAFDNVLPGSYTVTAASYVGTDSNIYNATISNPVTVDGGHAQLVATYSVQGTTTAGSATTTPQKSQTFYYDGTINSITNTGGSNYTVTVTFAQVPLHSNPNLSLVKQYAFPASANISWNLTAPKIYYTPSGKVNLNIQADGLCNSIWYSWGGYAPQAPAIAAQAAAVQTKTGHQLIGGVVMYTTRNSDSFDNMTDDVTNDYSIAFYLYNLMYEGTIMQAQYPTVKMTLLLNPDSTNAFQNCAQYYCPFIWKTGLTQDTTNKLIQIPNLQADSGKAIDRMVAKGYMTSGTATTIKALITSSGILVPPAGSGRTVPGVPELYLMQNLLLKQVAPNVPFGYGQNIYDNSNPLMAVGTPPVTGAPWETASATWLHKVNHLKYSSGVVMAAINFEGAKNAQFLKDMHYVTFTGDPFAAYAPDYVYVDIYERDPMPAAVGQGFLMNGVDLDTYFAYLTAIQTGIDFKTPWAIWQIPGASMQVTGTTLPNALSGTWPDYIFGHPALHNDMSNLDSSLNYASTSFVGYLNTSVYYTANSGVQNAEDYVKLTSAAAANDSWWQRLKKKLKGQD